jgi:hypothetical protein
MCYIFDIHKMSNESKVYTVCEYFIDFDDTDIKPIRSYLDKQSAIDFILSVSKETRDKKMKLIVIS